MDNYGKYIESNQNFLMYGRSFLYVEYSFTALTYK